MANLLNGELAAYSWKFPPIRKVNSPLNNQETEIMQTDFWNCECVHQSNFYKHEPLISFSVVPWSSAPRILSSVLLPVYIHFKKFSDSYYQRFASGWQMQKTKPTTKPPKLTNQSKRWALTYSTTILTLLLKNNGGKKPLKEKKNIS